MTYELPSVQHYLQFMQKIEEYYSENPKDLYWYDMKRRMKAIIDYMLAVTLKVHVETKLEKTQIWSLEFSIPEDTSITNSLTALLAEIGLPIREQVKKLYKLTERIQVKYVEMFQQVTNKRNEMQKLYSTDDYCVHITKTVEIPKISTNDLYNKATKDGVLKSIEEMAGDSIDNENADVYPKKKKGSSDLLIIGPYGTTIKESEYRRLLTKSAPGATRLLCHIVFGDEILATHSLTGTQSPGPKGRERAAKRKLDPYKTNDILLFIASEFNVSQQSVRSAINMKCTDSAKKLKRLLAKIV